MMTQEIAEAIMNWEDHDEVDHFEEIGKKTITGQSRWSTYYKQIYKDNRDGTFWSLNWGRGSTEQQYDGPENIQFWQVVPVEKTIVVYEKVK